MSKIFINQVMNYGHERFPLPLILHCRVIFINLAVFLIFLHSANFFKTAGLTEWPGEFFLDQEEKACRLRNGTMRRTDTGNPWATAMPGYAPCAAISITEKPRPGNARTALLPVIPSNMFCPEKLRPYGKPGGHTKSQLFPTESERMIVNGSGL